MAVYMADSNLIKDLSIVREYFSHNMRTSTAMVVATVSMFKYGLSDDIDNMSDIVIESAYFLDIYDKGMETLFSYLFDNKIRNDKEQIDPLKIAGRLIEDIKNSTKTQGVEIECSFDTMNINNTNSYAVKTLIELILCEEIRKSESKLILKAKGNTFTIIREKPSELPAIYSIFARFLKELNIEFTYNNETLILRFA